MSNFTTVKISKDTFRLLVGYKALLERFMGEGFTYSDALMTSILLADWHIATILGLTNKDLKEYKDELFNKLKSKDENVEVISLLEEANAFGFDLVKSKTK